MKMEAIPVKECIKNIEPEPFHLLLDRGEMKKNRLNHLVVLIKGAGEMGTGVASRLFRANFRNIVMLETASPLAVRRRVSFCEAIHDHTMAVEGIEAVKVSEEYRSHRGMGGRKDCSPSGPEVGQHP